VACSAGVNRSAVVREYLRRYMDDNCKIYLQYGAKDGDPDANVIMAYDTTSKKDGFCSVFGKTKEKNFQKHMFEILGYNDSGSKITLQEKDKQKYRILLNHHYWNIEPMKHNIFVIVNERDSVIELVKKRLLEVSKPVDLVVIKLKDTIYEPNYNIPAQSEIAYKLFIEKIAPLFEFEALLSYQSSNTTF
jgi:hypothetical protein